MPGSTLMGKAGVFTLSKSQSDKIITEQMRAAFHLRVASVASLEDPVEISMSKSAA